VTGWERKIQEPVKDLYPSSALSDEEDSSLSNLIITSGSRPSSQSETRKPKNPWDYDIRPPTSFVERPALPTGSSSSRLSSTTRTPLHQRVSAAREASVDYSIGDRDAAKSKALGAPARQRGSTGYRPMPQSMRAVAGLVEDRIDRARREGVFDRLPGRGKPFERDANESNPFIDRTEKLMNRIVQRQGAAPPWIELQRGLQPSPFSFLLPTFSTSFDVKTVERILIFSLFVCHKQSWKPSCRPSEAVSETRGSDVAPGCSAFKC
jgi:hypothetical protein